MGLSDSMARSAAAQGMMGMGSSPDPSMPPDLGGGGMPPEATPPPDLDSALAGVDAALDGMDPDIAGQIREHLNAIKEIASQDVGSQDKQEGEPSQGTGDNSVPSSGMEGAPSMSMPAPGM